MITLQDRDHFLHHYKIVITSYIITRSWSLPTSLQDRDHFLHHYKIVITSYIITRSWSLPTSLQDRDHFLHHYKIVITSYISAGKSSCFRLVDGRLESVSRCSRSGCVFSRRMPCCSPGSLVWVQCVCCDLLCGYSVFAVISCVGTVCLL